MKKLIYAYVIHGPTISDGSLSTHKMLRSAISPIPVGDILTTGKFAA